MKNAGNHFQQGMDEMLEEEPKARGQFADAYIDDTLIWSKAMVEHRRHVREVLNRMYVNNVKPKWSKCHFGVTRVKWCGRIISKEGIETDRNKVEALRKLEAPTKFKEVQKLYGMLLWHKAWIPHFHTLAAPIAKFLQHKYKWRRIEWGKHEKQATDRIIKHIEEACTRSRSGPGTYHIYVDWSTKAAGYHLVREHKGQKYLMGYGSKAFRRHETRYGAPKGELYAMALACRHFRWWCLGKDVVIHTDHQSWRDLNSNSTHARSGSKVKPTQ